MSATDASAFDGYEGLVAALRANPPVAPVRLRQQVLAGEPRRRRLPSRRLALVVVPVAVALAVGAAVVHGFVSPGSRASMEPTLQGADRGLIQHGEKNVAPLQSSTTTPSFSAHVPSGQPARTVATGD